MSLILNIDSTSDEAYVSIAKDGIEISSGRNPSMKDHAGFLHKGIETLCRETGIALTELDAIAVSVGPGSYTGLRVGMATAKGLCYALGKPFIALNSLLIAAASLRQEIEPGKKYSGHLLCPMTDARRMEVFTALYDQGLAERMPAKAMILDATVFDNWLNSYKVLFFGSGAAKWKLLCTHPHAAFHSPESRSSGMNALSYKFLQNHDFTELVDSQPLYLKEFHSGR